MSIQQSINQAISGSLYILGQSKLYGTLRDERKTKLEAKKNRLDSLMNTVVEEQIPQPVLEEESHNEGSLPSQQDSYSSEKESPAVSEYPYSQQIAEFDLQQHLQRKVKEASRSEQLSREFRGQLTGRSDTLG